MADQLSSDGMAESVKDRSKDGAKSRSMDMDFASVIDNSNKTIVPGALQVIKRNNQLVPYDSRKIMLAVTKAYLAVEGQQSAESSSVRDKVEKFVNEVTEYFSKRIHSGGVIHIEDIQDRVELVLMRAGEHKVARDYVLYREEHRKSREEMSDGKSNDLADSSDQSEENIVNIKQEDGSLKPLDKVRLDGIVKEACSNLTDVNPQMIIDDVMNNIFDGIPAKDISAALVMSSRTLVESEPNYSYVAARLLLDQLRSEALKFLGVAEQASMQQMQEYYPKAFEAFINKGVELELLDPILREYDLNSLGEALDPTRDSQFTYLSMQTLYDRYLIHSHGSRFELPQIFFMRVAMGLCINEPKESKTARVVEFYNQISSFDYMCSTPTLFNSGTLRSQLSSCYLTTISDDLHGIYSSMRDNALLSKFAGGLGNDWTNVRSLGSHIKGTNGVSQGIIPFLKVANDTAVAVNQGGKRKGAICAYLENWHLDVEEFLDLRKNSGDDRRRTHDMNTAIWVPDLFMKRLFADKPWTLFSPDETPDLHDLIGDEFEKAYCEYENKAAAGDIKNYKTIPAKTLWRKMLSMLFETGHPWITFKDVCNLRSPQQHCGVVHSSNLCTEITLNTSEDEIAVCNLGSVNIPAHMQDGKINREKLKNTITTAIRMLDNVIDINYYSVPQAKNSNFKHRPIGMGLMGFQDALYQKDIPYDSQEAVEFADELMELISYYAISASSDLAFERGSYQSFTGSLWDQGILPIDSIKKVQDTRDPEQMTQDTTTRLDWDFLRQKIKSQGMRNSNVMAIAPTATISNICGVSQSIEPTYQNLYVKSNLSGEFTVVNPYLVKSLKEKNLWDSVMINDLKYYNGSVEKIDRVPKDVKRVFATAFEVDMNYVLEAASRRQKWIDQAQSLNVYIAKPSGKKLDQVYRQAWKIGLKTTYYLRSLAATSTEKSTVSKTDLNAVASGPSTSNSPKVCSILDPDCDACQ